MVIKGSVDQRTPKCILNALQIALYKHPPNALMVSYLSFKLTEMYNFKMQQMKGDICVKKILVIF